ncbi:response regulator transcription factor [Desulfuromonas thiophila]|uniref:response regulator transcription factor n=1 Tax=Desulfuromonas thiophila TaxID=57664 RepID=UPI0024A8D061|nr:response regulator transcription factor [Desulfuromonas thiophila]
MEQREYLKEMTVLLAEDDMIVRDSTAQALEIFVRRVIAVEDGIAALHQFYSGIADIVILDIKMPGKSGLEVAQEIRQSDDVTPIFIVSSFNDCDQLHRAIPLLLIDYLIKPLNFAQLKMALIKSVDYLDKRGGLTYPLGEGIHYNKRSGSLITTAGQEIMLSMREKQLLDLLITNRNRLVTKERLEDLVFNMECSETSLKNLVYRLKKKIPANRIVNVRDLGYMLAEKN